MFDRGSWYCPVLNVDDWDVGSASDIDREHVRRGSVVLGSGRRWSDTRAMSVVR
jgi:hypothetical protein